MLRTHQLEQLLRTVPYIAALGVRIDEAKPGHVVLTVPDASGHHDHTGAVHPAAIFTLGETAAGIAVGTHPVVGPLQKLQKSARIEYVAVARGVLTASARVADGDAQRIAAGVKTGRQLLDVTATIRAGDVPVAEVTATFSFRQRA